MNSPKLTDYDAIIVGGGPAGLSAALTLGRSRRRVLVASAGSTRNATARHAHNIFTRDGTAPADLVKIGRDQLKPYDVSVKDGWATDAFQIDRGFQIAFEDGVSYTSRAVVLATGVKDILPDKPGFRELWGKDIFHCPYCHGWEMAGRPLGIYSKSAAPEKTMHLCQLIRGWSDDVILFTDGPSGLDANDLELLEINGIQVLEDQVERLNARDDELESIVLDSGKHIARGGLLISPDQELASDLPHRLGCPLTNDGRVQSGIAGRTEIPGVFVAGDMGPGMQSVASAAASGALAGAMLNHDLLEKDFIRSSGPGTS